LPRIGERPDPGDRTLKDIDRSCREPMRRDGSFDNIEAFQRIIWDPVADVVKLAGNSGPNGIQAGLNMVYRGLPTSTVGTPIPFLTVTW
jgi:hypothetical protein